MINTSSTADNKSCTVPLRRAGGNLRGGGAGFKRDAPPRLLRKQKPKLSPRQNGGLAGHSGQVSPVQRADPGARHPEVQPPLLRAMHRGPVERHAGRALPLPGVEVQHGVPVSAVSQQLHPAARRRPPASAPRQRRYRQNRSSAGRLIHYKSLLIGWKHCTGVNISGTNVSGSWVLKSGRSPLNSVILVGCWQ